MFSARAWQAPPVTQAECSAFSRIWSDRPEDFGGLDCIHARSRPFRRLPPGQLADSQTPGRTRSAGPPLRRCQLRRGPLLWGLPGGHVEDTETLAQAAARETLEEVGLTVEARTLRPLGMARYVDGGVRGADFFFLATDWRGEPAPVSECSEVAWFSPQALPHDALPWLAATLAHQLGGGAWLSETLG